MTPDPYRRASDAITRWRETARELQTLMRVEDPASPTSPSLDPGGGGTGDPTYNQAIARDARFLHRVAATLERSADELEKRRRVLTPRRIRPEKPCQCCRDPNRLATHRMTATTERDGVRRTRTLDVCWWCFDVDRKRGYCGDDVHADMPTGRMCECGPECCPAGCPDMVSPGRLHLSDRCQRRKSPDRRRPRS